jgi:hypothetical protein
MNFRQRKRVMLLGAVVLGCASAAVLAGTFMLPVQVEPRVDADAAPSPGKGDKQDQPADPGPGDPPVEEELLRQLSAIDLRRALYDQPETPDKQPPGQPKPKLQLRLVGTAEEPGHSTGFFLKPDGQIELLSAGETLKTPRGEVTVIEVKDRVARVRFAGQEIQLKAPPRPGEAVGR